MIDLPIQCPDMHPSTLVLRKGKWYVAVTVPKSLEGLFSQKQLRRSTGTSDEKIAANRKHKLTEVLYREIKLKWQVARSGTLSSLKSRWESDAIELAMSFGLHREGMNPDKYRSYLDQAAQDVLNEAMFEGKPVETSQVDAAISYVGWETIDESEWKKLNSLATVDSGTNTRTTAAAFGATILSTLDDYAERRRWNREATKKNSIQHIKRFAELIGNIELTKIEKAHAYDYAIAMDSEGKANKTIKSTISSVTAFLTWCEQQRLLSEAPFYNLKLANYGAESQKYLPLKKEELHALFAQEMPHEDRFLLTVLVTTGMRLDEAALLTWQRIKTVDNIRCFDLTDYEEAITIKNKQSARLVPIPTVCSLPNGNSSGPIFTYRRGSDGKAENAASKALMKHIRKVTDDERKVVHSLRGNLKDMLRDAGVSKELSDFITGHGSHDEGGKYGSGHSLVLKKQALESVEHPWLNSPTDS